MFYLKDYSDPIGKVHEIASVETILNDLKIVWKESKSKKSFWMPKINFSRITNFLLFSLDLFVNAVNESVIPGPDKKATVLNAIDKLYDYTVKETMPIYLMPFASSIKSYIVYVLVSNFIDWIVSKYRSKNWTPVNFHGGKYE